MGFCIMSEFNIFSKKSYAHTLPLQERQEERHTQISPQLSDKHLLVRNVFFFLFLRNEYLQCLFYRDSLGVLFFSRDSFRGWIAVYQQKTKIHFFRSTTMKQRRVMSHAPLTIITHPLRVHDHEPQCHILSPGDVWAFYFILFFLAHALIPQHFHFFVPDLNTLSTLLKFYSLYWLHVGMAQSYCLSFYLFFFFFWGDKLIIQLSILQIAITFLVRYRPYYYFHT